MNNKISIEDNIFVAGGTGMAGSSIIRMLRRNGYGNLNNGGKILAPSRKELDLSDLNAVNQWFSKNKPSVVIIAAAKVGGILANSALPADFILQNLKIQTNIIETAWKSNVKRLLFLGSSCIYPKLSEQPITEESLLTGLLEETNQWYAISKIAGIKLCQALRIQYGFDAICLMPTNLYGPGDNYHPEYSHVMAALLRKFYFATKNNKSEVICWGSGKPLREFLHVDDLGEAVTFALEKWDPNLSESPKDKEGNPLIYLNVGTGEDISIKNLALKISKAINYKGNILWDTSKPDGTMKKQLNIEKFTNLGWKSKIKLDIGIKETVLKINEELDLEISE